MDWEMISCSSEERSSTPPAPSRLWGPWSRLEGSLRSEPGSSSWYQRWIQNLHDWEMKESHWKIHFTADQNYYIRDKNWLIVWLILRLWFTVFSKSVQSSWISIFRYLTTGSFDVLCDRPTQSNPRLRRGRTFNWMKTREYGKPSTVR